MGGIVGTMADEDPTEAIDAARRGLINAEKFKVIARNRLDLLKVYDLATEQLKSLYIVYSTCRGAIEQALTHNELDEV